MKVRTQQNFNRKTRETVFGISIMPDGGRRYCKYPIGHQEYKDYTQAYQAMKDVQKILDMRCKCGGDMMHTKSSKQAPPSYVKVHNWVRPNLEQTMSLSEGMRNHILNGGLILEDELK